MNFVVTVDDRAQRVEVRGGGGRYQVTIDGTAWDVDARATEPGIYSLLIDGISHLVDVAPRDESWVVDVGGDTYTVQVEEATRYVIRTKGGAAGSGRGQTLAAPLPGRIAHVAVRVGDRVEAGDPLVVIEAMKMENELRAATAGAVAEVRVEEGQAVNAGDVLVVIS
jgi:biotin carboxyl carrier protein